MTSWRQYLPHSSHPSGSSTTPTPNDPAVFEGQTEVSSHASHFERIESFTTELDETSAADAEALLYLVRRGFGTCRDYMDELRVIFGPLQQRSVEELERAIQIKKVSEAIDKETGVMDVG